MKLTMPGELLPVKSDSSDIAELVAHGKVEQNPGLILAKGNILVAKEAFQSIQLTHENFFGQQEHDGYVSKPGFLATLYNMSRGELQSVKTLFELMAQETVIKVFSSQKVNAQGQTTVRCSYEKDDVTYVLFIRTTGHMHQMLQLYEFSILTCQTSLEELYFEALA